MQTTWAKLHFDRQYVLIYIFKHLSVIHSFKISSKIPYFENILSQCWLLGCWCGRLGYIPGPARFICSQVKSCDTRSVKGRDWCSTYTAGNPRNARAEVEQQVSCNSWVWDLKMAPTMFIECPFLFARFQLCASGFHYVLGNMYIQVSCMSILLTLIIFS